MLPPTKTSLLVPVPPTVNPKNAHHGLKAFVALLVVGLIVWLGWLLYKRYYKKSSSDQTKSDSNNNTVTSSGSTTSSNTGTGNGTGNGTGTRTGTGTATAPILRPGPTTVTILSVSQGSMNATWNSSPDTTVQGINSLIGPIGSTPTIVVYPYEFSSGIYSITGLTVGQQYVLGIQYVFDDGTFSQMTISSNNTATAGTFAGPTGITAVENPSSPTDTIDVTWNTIAAATNQYQIAVDTSSPVSGNCRYGTNAPPSATSASVSELPAGTTLYVTVLGMDNDGNSAYPAQTVTVTTASS